MSVAILDPKGTIVGVNESWRNFGRRNGLRIPNFGVGRSYLQYCQSEPASLQVGRDLRDLLAGKIDLLTRIYPCDSPTEKRWFYLFGLPLSLEGRSGVALLHVDLTPFLQPLTRTNAARPGKAQLRGFDLKLVAKSVETSSLEALSSQLNAMLTANHRAPSRSSHKDHERIEACLSKRQLQVLRLLGEGKTNNEIAKALCRSPNTVKLHVSKILSQLNVKSRTQAALLASKLVNNDDLLSNGDWDVVGQ